MASVLAKSKIVRSWPATFAYLGAGLACLAIGVAIFLFADVGLWLGAIALAMVILGLVFCYMAVGGAGTSVCPGCGKELGGLSTGTNQGVLCAACHQYFEGTGGELWATDQSKVADSPLFSSPLPESFAFPDGCCVCGQPETHRVKVSMTTTGGGNVALAAATGIQSSTRTSVEVPHCADHKDGALLSGTKDKPTIRFRSYPYLRAFCEKNNTTPT